MSSGRLRSGSRVSVERANRSQIRAEGAAADCVGHLRDIEELFLIRLEAIAAIDEPVIPAAGMGARAMNLKPDGQAAAPERWAEDRQYLRNDVGEALAAFRGVARRRLPISLRYLRSNGDEAGSIPGGVD